MREHGLKHGAREDDGGTVPSLFTTLEDVRVLDFTSQLAGPFTTMILADLGADVIKVEPPGVGDSTRHTGSFQAQQGVVFRMVNRNKHSVALDLKNPEQLEEALRLGEAADVVVENFRPGTADRLGIGYEAFKARNPKIIYCSLSGFGRGPAGRKLGGAMDTVVQSIAGLMTWAGHPKPRPHRILQPTLDMSTGMWGAIGIMAALMLRRRTGEGQLVEAAMIDSAFVFNSLQVLPYVSSGAPEEDAPGQLPRSGSPYEPIQTAEGWITVSVPNDRVFAGLCRALGAAELAVDDRFRTSDGRVTNRDELAALLDAMFLADSAGSWAARLREEGVPASPVNNLAQAMVEPIVEERQLIIGDESPVVRLPLTANGMPRRSFTQAPPLGEHNEQIDARMPWRDR